MLFRIEYYVLVLEVYTLKLQLNLSSIHRITVCF